MRISAQIFETFEDPGYSTFAKYYSIGMMLLIVLATLCFVLESEATVKGGTLYETSALAVFQNIELVSVIIFTIEYVLRLVCCPLQNWGVIRFVLNVQNLIDLLACLPFWITMIIVAMSPGTTTGGFGFLRVVRLVRVFRVFKFGKYSHGLAMMAGAIAKSSQPLSILAFSVMLATIILSSIMYLFEGDIGNKAAATYNSTQQLLDDSGYSPEAHLYCFGTIPRCFWWSFITMTTVGYGDCYPITVLGKMLAMTTAVLGVLILALPITVVGSNFQKMVEMYDEESSTMREFDASEDGNIDLDELRSFIAAKRKDNVLRKEVDLNPVRLMAKYDPQGNGTLSFEEFAVLKRDIIDPAAADPQANMRLLLKRVTDNDKGLQLLREQMNRIERLLEESLGKSGAGAQAEARDGSADASGAPAAKLPPLPNAPLSPGREE